MDEREEKVGGVMAVESEGGPVAIEAGPIEGEPTIVLKVTGNLGPGGEWIVLPWELSAEIDEASKRPPRAPRVDPSMPDPPDTTAPFDIVVGATRRAEPPPIDTREDIPGQARRSRAVAAMERGMAAFDLHVLLVVHGISGVRAGIIGVAGNEVTISALKLVGYVCQGAEHALKQRQGHG